MKSDHPFNRWLKSSGYTVREIARECGVSRTAVYNWAYGLTAPSTVHLAHLGRLSKGSVQAWFWLPVDHNGGPNDNAH